MNRELKTLLLLRQLGLRHKLKVHDSMKQSETHEEVALSTLSRWDLEDEIVAIENILQDARKVSVAEKRTEIERSGAPKKKPKK